MDAPRANGFPSPRIPSIPDPVQEGAGLRGEGTAFCAGPRRRLLPGFSWDGEAEGRGLVG